MISNPKAPFPIESEASVTEVTDFLRIYIYERGGGRNGYHSHARARGIESSSHALTSGPIPIKSVTSVTGGSSPIGNATLRLLISSNFSNHFSNRRGLL